MFLAVIILLVVVVAYVTKVMIDKASADKASADKASADKASADKAPAMPVPSMQVPSMPASAMPASAMPASAMPVPIKLPEIKHKRWDDYTFTGGCSIPDDNCAYQWNGKIMRRQGEVTKNASVDECVAKAQADGYKAFLAYNQPGAADKPPVDKPVSCTFFKDLSCLGKQKVVNAAAKGWQIVEMGDYTLPTSIDTPECLDPKPAPKTAPATASAPAPVQAPKPAPKPVHAPVAFSNWKNYHLVGDYLANNDPTKRGGMKTFDLTKEECINKASDDRYPVLFIHEIENLASPMTECTYFRDIQCLGKEEISNPLAIGWSVVEIGDTKLPVGLAKLAPECGYKPAMPAPASAPVPAPLPAPMPMPAPTPAPTPAPAPAPAPTRVIPTTMPASAPAQTASKLPTPGPNTQQNCITSCLQQSRLDPKFNLNLCVVQCYGK